jgi:hypothetical protein
MPRRLELTRALLAKSAQYQVIVRKLVSLPAQVHGSVLVMTGPE